MSLFDASVQRLRARVGRLDADLEWWTDRTSAHGALPQHHSQVQRLHDYLGGMLDAVVRGTPIDLATGPPFAGTVDDVPGLRRGVGSVHLVWDFFRDKLTQRDTPAYADHLGAADDLAWACYQPFLLAATGPAEVREPPLVFYTTDRSPFAQARTRTLHPPGLDSLDLQVFQAALQRLPVPVIGMPWDIANRMPETCLIGHEAGHVIAEDLHLAAEAATALREATFENDPDGVRKSVWSAWSDEIFADVIGVLATGSAYLDGLIVELADAATEIHAAPIDPRRPGRYPPRMLRVALCERFLGRVGVVAPAMWTETYGGIDGPAEAFTEDLAVVTAALMDRAWAAIGGRRLAGVLPWNARMEADARTVGRTELAAMPAPVSFDVRLWVAASMHAYRADPGRYTSRGLDARLARAIVGRRLAGTRSSGPDRTTTRTFDARDSWAQLQKADRLAGAELAHQLGLAPTT